MKQEVTKVLKGSVKSKTVWFNTITGALLALEPVFPLLQPMLGDAWYGVGMAVLTVGNVILRGMTNKALADK
jgi:hypothetical protein